MTLTKIDNILNLYSLINEKTKFIKFAANDLGVSFFTIRNNWIGVGIIPEKKQDPFLKLLQNWIKIQNEVN